MDYTIRNNAKFFDEVLDVLTRHENEPGVGQALEDLRAAKVNYTQRSIDHMLNGLILAIHDLLSQTNSGALLNDLKSVIRTYVNGILQAGSKLRDLAHQYEAGGGRQLSHDEILREVDDRRGASR